MAYPKTEKLYPLNMRGKPTTKNATNPSPKMAKFVLTTWAACFARQNPVSTRAKPACMKITSTAPMMIQRLLSPRSVWLMPLIGLTSIEGSTAKDATLVMSTKAMAIAATMDVLRSIRLT